MPLFFWQFVAVAVGYLLGSVSFAVLVSRVLGLQDPRSYGSGNPGATNVLRSGSKAAAIAVLVLDVLKGWLPVALVLGICLRFVDDFRITPKKRKNKRIKELRKHLSLVFQFPEYQLFEETVEKDVAFGLRNFGFKENSPMDLETKTQYPCFNESEMINQSRKKKVL